MLVVSSASLQAQGITPDMLQRITTSNQLTPSDRAIRNALSVTSVKSISQSQDNLTEMDTYFSINVPTKGITDQKSSGRCWLFTGLNVLRSKVINSRQLGGLEFSEVYLFFYDRSMFFTLLVSGLSSIPVVIKTSKRVKKRFDELNEEIDELLNESRPS